MSTFRTPVGPQPASVYWRRRLVLGIGLVAVIVIVLLIVFSPKGGEPTPVQTTSSSTDKTESSNAPVDVAACVPAAITVTAITDKTSYTASEQPLVSMSITNNGAADCTINAGTDAQVYTITSGSDQIWTSTDCQSAPAPAEVTLKPGVPQATTPFAWDRTRSSTTTCDGSRPAAVSGGASPPTYKLTVKLGDLESAAVSFLLG